MKGRRLKPVWVSILTVVVFTVALLIGMQTDWWQTEGRRTPLAGDTRGHGGESYRKYDEDDNQIDEIYEEEEHKTGEVYGSSTVQDALDLGIPLEEIERILQGAVDSITARLKISPQRGACGLARSGRSLTAC